MVNYLALLRGVNVGGNSIIKMSELAEALSTDVLTNVRTYIQSGNIIFSSDITDTTKLASMIKSIIDKRFGLIVDVVVFSFSEWKQVIENAPKWWGTDESLKHNLLVLIKPLQASEVLDAIGNLKPDIEALEPGNGVLYQSLSREKFGRTTAAKLIAHPLYKKITIRNYNTSTKLLTLLA